MMHSKREIRILSGIRLLGRFCRETRDEGMRQVYAHAAMGQAARRAERSRSRQLTAEVLA